MTNTYISQLLNKYEDIIKEEINIKEIQAFETDMEIKKIFKPIGTQISEKFGKDTGKVIQYGKKGNIVELENGQIEIFGDNEEKWILDKTDYEIAYQGLEGNDIAVDGDFIVRLDLHIDEQLQKEGMSREISRFLNQMRKEADYNVDSKVTLTYETEDQSLSSIITEFSDFLKKEALIKEIVQSNTKPEGDIVSLFNNDESTIIFSLKN